MAEGFDIVAVFDSNPDKIGQEVAGKKVQDSAKLLKVVRERGIKVAIVAVPVAAAQKVVDMLVEAGIKAILNYAPIHVSVPADIRIQYIDPIAHLQRMMFHLE